MIGVFAMKELEVTGEEPRFLFRAMCEQRAANLRTLAAHAAIRHMLFQVSPINWMITNPAIDRVEVSFARFMAELQSYHEQVPGHKNLFFDYEQDVAWFLSRAHPNSNKDVVWMTRLCSAASM